MTTLSSKIEDASYITYSKMVIPVENIKESLSKIKKKINNPNGQVDCSVGCIFRIIEKEMGSKLKW